MNKFLMKLSACSAAAVMILSGGGVSVLGNSITEGLPAAGAARVLNEGKSVTAIRAEKIRSTGQVEESYVTAVTLAAAEATEKAAQEVIVVSLEDSEKEKKESAAESTPTDVPSAGAGTFAAESDGDQSTSAVPADVRSESKEKEEDGEARRATSVEDLETGIQAGAGSVIEVPSEVDSSEDADGEMDLVKAVADAQHKEEDFSHLVIAQVDNYVNVRTEPTEESEVAGKLYDKSVGNELEIEGDWIKIRSGNTEGYVKSEFVVRGEEAVDLAKKVGTRTAKVTTTTLYVRQGPSRESEVLGMVPMDDCLTVLEETDDGWAKVSIEEGDGYVSTEFVHLYTEFVRAESKAEEEARLAREEAEREAARRAAAEAEKKARREAEKKAQKSGKSSSGSSKSSGSSGGKSSGYAASGSGSGAAVANYALQFVGNPYVYGGTSLTNGADCSGFVMSVYRNFGISLPHSSGADRSVGSAVSGGLANAQAGDIVCYSGHVGIYIGNGQIVHASTRKTGIKVSNAGYRTPVAVRRIF